MKVAGIRVPFLLLFWLLANSTSCRWSGGGVNAELIFSTCETKVGSPGIQLPITTRPPGFVTRHRRQFDPDGCTSSHRLSRWQQRNEKSRVHRLTHQRQRTGGKGKAGSESGEAG